MAIALKEYCGPNNINNEGLEKDVKITEAASDMLAPKADTLMVEVEGIHAFPFHTRNYTRYMPEALKKSQSKWSSPYLKPLIKHHNDMNGEIIGRIYNAAYTEQTSVKNAGGLIFTISVPDKKAAEDVENRILETVSIGVSANDVRCSVCGAQITDASEGCPEGHARGGVYNGETCYWDIYDMDPKELSYVIVPSDQFAKNKRIYRASEKNMKTSIINNSESANNNLDTDVNIKEADKNINNQDNGDNNKMDLEKQLAEANAKIAELQAQLEKANQDLDQLKELQRIKAEKEELDKKLAEIQALLDGKSKEVEEKDKELADEKAKLVVSEENLNAVSQEKEAADKAGMELQEQFKKFAESVLNTYRKMASKREFTEEELKNRSMDSVMNAISDIKEELDGNINNGGVKIIEGQKIPNPVAPKNDKPTKTTPNKDYASVNLGEGLESLFAQAASIH